MEKARRPLEGGRAGWVVGSAAWPESGRQPPGRESGSGSGKSLLRCAAAGRSQTLPRLSPRLEPFAVTGHPRGPLKEDAGNRRGEGGERRTYWNFIGLRDKNCSQKLHVHLGLLFPALQKEVLQSQHFFNRALFSRTRVTGTMQSCFANFPTISKAFRHGRAALLVLKGAENSLGRFIFLFSWTLCFWLM